MPRRRLSFDPAPAPKSASRSGRAPSSCGRRGGGDRRTCDDTSLPNLGCALLSHQCASASMSYGLGILTHLLSISVVRLRVEPVQEFVFKEAPKFTFPLTKRVGRDVSLSSPAGDSFHIQTQVLRRFFRIHRSRTARRVPIDLVCGRG